MVPLVPDEPDEPEVAPVPELPDVPDVVWLVPLVPAAEIAVPITAVLFACIAFNKFLNATIAINLSSKKTRSHARVI